MNHLNQSAHHLLAGGEVGYHPVAQRTDCTDARILFLIHHLGLIAHGNHLVGATVEGHYRGLIDNNLIITDNDGVGGTQIHCNTLNKTKKSHL